MNRPDYHRATRNAYRTLLATKIDALPIDIDTVCARCRNTRVLSFREACSRYEGFEPFYDGPSRTAFTLRQFEGDLAHNIIFWNDEDMRRGSGVYRFSLAHELGHIVLRHSEDSGYAAELEANVFAQHLLCPRPVLEVLQPKDHYEIMHLCGVSQSAARIVFSTLRQENGYMDGDMWNGIFQAFSLDERRGVVDHLSPVAALALEIRRR
jgi:hypothetical protein